MALYKGVEIDEQMIDLIGRMGKVEEYQESSSRFWNSYISSFQAVPLNRFVS